MIRAIIRALITSLCATELVAQGGVAGNEIRSASVRVLAGQVVDAGNGKPVEGAIVTIDPIAAPGSNVSTRAIVDSTDLASARSMASETAADGRFRFEIAGGGRYRAVVRAPGYARLERTLEPTDLDGLLVLALRAVPVALDAMTITASRREQRLADAIVPTVLISRREIEESGASDVASVLTEQTGVQLDAGVPAGAGVQLQGFGDRRVLILLDGQPLVGRINGNLDLARLPLAMVSHIEIVKGPQSTLFGSDAIGGVVNVVTRRNRIAPASIVVSATGGSQGRRDVDVGLTQTLGGVEYSADVGRHETALTSGVSGNDGTFARSWNGRGSADYRLAPGRELFASLFGVLEEQRYRTGQIYRFSDNDQWSGRAGARLQHGAHRLVPLFYVSRFTHLSRGALAPRPVSDSGARDVQTLYEAELAYNGLFSRTAIDAGVELRREQISADRVPGGTRSLDGVESFGQLTLPLGTVSLAAGGRVSHSEQWGTSATPRLAALWRPAEPLGIRASISRGFRAPDFKEMYLEFVNQSAGYAVMGNPALKPERSTSAALSVEWAGSSLYSSAEVFAHDYTNFIQSVLADDAGTYSYDNVGRGTSRGLELDVAATAGNLRGEAGYALLRTRDHATRQALLGRAEHSGRASLALAPRRLPRLSITGIFTGSAPLQRDASGNVIREQAGYARMDIRVAHDVRRDLTLSLGADNVFDRQLGTDWPGYTGRRVYAGASWRALGDPR